MDNQNNPVTAMAKHTPAIKLRHRLLTRLLVSYILVASLPLLFTGKVLVDTAHDSIRQTILDRNLEFTIRSTRLVDFKLQTARDIINSQAKTQSIYEMNRLNVELAINTVKSEFELFDELVVLDTLGSVLASTSFEYESEGRFSRNGIFGKIISGSSYRSDVYVSEEHLPMLDLAEAIKRHDEIVGVLFAVVDLKAMWDLVQENVVGEKGEAFIFNNAGVYIAHSDAKKVYSNQTFANPEIISKIAEGLHGQTIYKTEDGVEMVAAYAPIGGYGWGAMIQQPTSEAFASADRMRVRVVQFMIGTIILAMMLAYFYSRWIVKPVNHLVWGMDSFSKGELNYRVEKVTNDEIGALAVNFNDMADRLIEYQNTIKRTERLETLGKLAAVLSHEIRNPLNSMVINMQILKRELSSERFNRTRVENFYNVLAAEIKRVDQLVSDFLLIARPQSPKTSRVLLNEILNEVLMLHTADALKKGIRIERQYNDEPVFSEVDAGKMKQAFLNLVINAIQAMPGGGKLTVELKNSTPGGRRQKGGKFASVAFHDTGLGIKKEDLAKIFDFYYSTKKDGSGLGLAIVQQIVDEHHGKINVQSKVNHGTTFTILLPQE
jgi:signal transduction histidine kinase